MKSRRVIFTVEVESNEPIKDLRANIRDSLDWTVPPDGIMTEVIQIQADVFKSYFKKRSNQEGGPC